MKKCVKRAVLSLVVLLGVLVAVVGSYAIYVFGTYYRLEDNISLNIDGAGAEDSAKIGKSYTIVSQNLGFGAYSPEFTFFMDGGKQSVAKSKESVLDLINKGVDKVSSFSPDFVLFQEIDTDSTRSYHVNQADLIRSRFVGFSSSFAVNYHSPFLMYPILEPHGASNSGILTLSKASVSSSLRRSLPISTSLSKILDLDRCYSVSRVPTENGKELVLYNVHLSAYGIDDNVRKGQLTMLFNDMKSEYDKGNYIVCGGDFNHDFTGTSTQDLNGGEEVDFGWAQPFPDEYIPEGFSKCVAYESLAPTCRNCDIPYIEGNFTIITDGFIVSDNVECQKAQNVHTGFAYADHNPVVMSFCLR